MPDRSGNTFRQSSLWGSLFIALVYTCGQNMLDASGYAGSLTGFPHDIAVKQPTYVSTGTGYQTETRFNDGTGHISPREVARRLYDIRSNIVARTLFFLLCGG